MHSRIMKTEGDYLKVVRKLSVADQVLVAQKLVRWARMIRENVDRLSGLEPLASQSLPVSLRSDFGAN